MTRRMKVEHAVAAKTVAPALDSDGNIDVDQTMAMVEKTLRTPGIKLLGLVSPGLRRAHRASMSTFRGELEIIRQANEKKSQSDGGDEPRN